MAGNGGAPWVSRGWPASEPEPHPAREQKASCAFILLASGRTWRHGGMRQPLRDH